MQATKVLILLFTFLITSNAQQPIPLNLLYYTLFSSESFESNQGTNGNSMVNQLNWLNSIRNLQTETTSSRNELSSSDLTSAQPTESTDTTLTSASDLTTELSVPCVAAGITPHPTDCSKYYTCEVDNVGNFAQIEQLCPPRSAYSLALNRCTRDISSCGGFQCIFPGKFPDPTSNQLYFLCAKNYNAFGLQKYHVKCENYKIFRPEIGKCIWDMETMLSGGFQVQPWEQDDKDAVKAERSEQKRQAKLREKELKIQAKLEKEARKAEERRLKDEMKLARY